MGQRTILLTCIIATALLLTGCTRNEQALRAAAKALDTGEYDQAIQLASEAMDEDLTPAQQAEALYLRGRAYEQRPAASQAQLQSNMQSARTSYVEALHRRPSPELTTYIHASLGKVAFFQDDFSTAIDQLWLAYQKLSTPDQKAATLYYLGKSQQRSGRFKDADQTFTALIEQHPDSPWSQRATSSRGAKSFVVQLAAYKNPASLEAAAKSLSQRGIATSRATDKQGQYLLRAGPFGSYAQAKSTRQKIWDLYRSTNAFADATILP